MKIRLDDQDFGHLEAHKTIYEFDRNNSGPVICRDCKKGIAAGKGIYRQAYKRNGYLCFSCFSVDIPVTTKTIQGDSGFYVDTLGRLRACYLSSPSYSTVDIIEAVFRALLDESYTSIDILLGEEGAHPFAILDAAEASI